MEKPCNCGSKNTARAKSATRVSCLDCVEKHLGAAWVLLAEYRDGYPHRMRAVGHLHEAEDESQAWPELHDAIRAARKAYQKTCEIPAFESLAELVRAASVEPRPITPDVQRRLAMQFSGCRGCGDGPPL